MKVKYLHIIIFLLGILLNANILAQEFRIGIGHEQNLPYNFEFGSKMQIRKNVGLANAIYPVFQAGLTKKLYSFWSIGGALRYTALANENMENLHYGYSSKLRLTYDLKYEFKPTKNFILKNRLRFQNSYFQEKEQINCLRNKFTLNVKYWEDIKLFTSAEIYYSIEKKSLNKARLYTGCDFEIKNHELKIYLIIEQNLLKEDALPFRMVGISYNI